LTAKARLRSRHVEADCIVQPLADGDVMVEFKKPQYAAAPGQSVVFYQDDMVLGGGIILKVEKAEVVAFPQGKNETGIIS